MSGSPNWFSIPTHGLLRRTLIPAFRLISLGWYCECRKESPAPGRKSYLQEGKLSGGKKTHQGKEPPASRRKAELQVGKSSWTSRRQPSCRKGSPDAARKSPAVGMKNRQMEGKPSWRNGNVATERKTQLKEGNKAGENRTLMQEGKPNSWKERPGAKIKPIWAERKPSWAARRKSKLQEGNSAAGRKY